MTDVRSVTPAGVDYNTTGVDLSAKIGLRLTDKRNTSPGFADPGTLQDVTLNIPMTCTPTSQADPQLPNNVGSTCDATTSANALYPGIAASGKRTLFDLGKVQVRDAGTDNVADTADDELLAVQGVMVP
jgi:hypothetical protein